MTENPEPLDLPVPGGSESQADDAGASEAAHRRRVVVAEDDSMIRMDVVEMLSSEGYDVVGEAADGRRAVELTREHEPDLVLMDVKMPVLDGISAELGSSGADLGAQDFLDHRAAGDPGAVPGPVEVEVERQQLHAFS